MHYYAFFLLLMGGNGAAAAGPGPVVGDVIIMFRTRHY